MGAVCAGRTGGQAACEGEAGSTGRKLRTEHDGDEQDECEDGNGNRGHRRVRAPRGHIQVVVRRCGIS